MVTWTLFSPELPLLFVHSIIEVKEMADYVLPAKPDLAAEGAKFKCSICGHVAYYRSVFRTIATARGIRLILQGIRLDI